MPPQRLPIVNSDDGVWGDIIRQYLMKEHYNDDTDNAANGGHHKITIRAGTTAAGTAPIKLTSGSLMTAPEAGAIEFSNDTLYFTQTTGPTRTQIITNSGTQTLTNKTLTAPVLSGAITGTYQLQTSSNTAGGSQWTLDNTNTAGRDDLLLTEGGVSKAFVQWRGTTNGAIPNTLRVGTDASTSADVVILANGGTGIFISGGQNGLTSGNVGLGTSTPAAKLDVAGEIRASTAGTNSTSVVTVGGTQTLTNKTLTSPKVNWISDTNGGVALTIGAAASAVNYFSIANKAAGGSPSLSVWGSDTNLDLALVPRGTGAVTIYTSSGLTPTVKATGADTNHNLNLVSKGTGVVQANGAEVATVSGTQTLTNKTLTSPRINSILDGNGATVFGLANVASAVNSLYVSNNASGGTPHLKAQGADTNINIAISSKGTGAVRLQDGNFVTVLQAAGVTSAVNYFHVYNAVTTAAPTIQAIGADTNINVNFQPKGSGVATVNGVEIPTTTSATTLTNKTLTDPRINTVKDTNGNTAVQFPATASAVNFVNISNNATGGAPSILGTGSDTDVNLYIRPKGAGSVSIRDGSNNAIAFFGGVASAVNRFTLTNAATGSSPSITAGGSDTNVDLLLVSKGSGVVKANGAEVATKTYVDGKAVLGDPAGTPITNGADPVVGANNLYDLTGYVADETVTLPAISGLAEGDRLTVTKIDNTSYVVFVQPDGSDEFTTGASVVIAVSQFEQITLFVQNGKWSVAHGYISSSSMTSQFFTAMYAAIDTLTQDDIEDGVTYKRFSETEKTKLAGIATGATANDTDANLKNRANHTGTQTASTISDFSTAADAQITAAVGVTVQAYDADLTTWAGKTAPSGTVVGTSDTQTLTAKTISGANNTLTALPYDLSAVTFGYVTPRAVGTGDFPFGTKLQRACTLTSVTYRCNTADASGDLVVELRKNGVAVSGSAATIAAASQIAGGTATGSWSFSSGDILTVYVTAVGTTPGTGLIADITGVTA